MRNYINAMLNVISKPLTMRQTPIHIQLEPTTYCNLNCKMCGRSQYLSQSSHLSYEHFEHILSQIRPKKITLSGLGEPFTHSALLDMVRLAKQSGCSINTTTNCTLLSQERCEQIVTSGLDLIKISLDSATADTYYAIRGENRFLKVLDGIHALTDAKKRMNSVTPFIRLNYVMSQENYHEIAEVVALAEQLGVDAIYFQPLELVGIEERYSALVGNLTYEQFAAEIQCALEIAQKSRVNTNLQVIRQKLPLYWKKYQMEVYRTSSRKCILPWFSTYVTVDGFVRPCCSFSQTEANMGNIFEQSFQEIWNGKPYQGFRKAIRAGKRPYPICENCVPQTLFDIIRSSGILPGFLT